MDLVAEAQPPTKQLEELHVPDAHIRRIFLLVAQSTPQAERLPVTHNQVQDSAQDMKGARSDKSLELLRLPDLRFWCQTQKHRMRLTRSPRDPPQQARHPHRLAPDQA